MGILDSLPKQKLEATHAIWQFYTQNDEENDFHTFEQGVLPWKVLKGTPSQVWSFTFSSIGH